MQLKSKMVLNNPSASGVYILKFDSGFFYIGSTMRFRNRFNQHVRYINLNYNCPKTIYKAALASSAMEMDVLEYCDSEKLIEREAFYYNAYKNNPFLINIRSPKEQVGSKPSGSNKRIPIAELGKDEEIIKIYGSANELALEFEVIVSFIRKEIKIGHKIRGRIFRKLDENGNIIPPVKIIKPRKERKTPISAKSVSKFTLEGVFVENYKTIADAARSINRTKKGIYDVVYKKAKTCGGFVFEFA